MPAERDDIEAPVAVLVVAAGRGLRAGFDAPKQYRRLGGSPVLRQALTPFLAMPEIARIAIVIGAGDEARYADAVAGLSDERLTAPTLGGATRQDSVRLGLEALQSQGFRGTVLVHDAARPFLSEALARSAVAAVRPGTVAAIPVLPVTDTIKRLDEAGRIAETPPRDRLVSVQTPQAFAFEPLLSAHRQAAAEGRAGFTDDAALMEWAGHPVATFPGEPANMKLTHPEDFVRAEAPGSPLVVRVGTGYDVHAFGEGDHVWLGGVRIAHDRGVLAHSDGDVALHALTDALLATCGAGDIGDQKGRGPARCDPPPLVAPPFDHPDQRCMGNEAGIGMLPRKPMRLRNCRRVSRLGTPDIDRQRRHNATRPTQNWKYESQINGPIPSSAMAIMATAWITHN